MRGNCLYYVRHQNKYEAESTIYNGIQYHSKKEAAYAADLGYLKKAGEIKDWERQVKISLDVNGFHIANYWIDFIVEHNDGLKEYVEVKGYPTPDWKIKWKLFEALYSQEPNTKLTVVV